jgi:RNA polymerase sigma-70 factor (ECF subfamily)
MTLGASGTATFDWASLYETHAGELAGYLAKLTGDRDAGLELMQETFVQALRAERSIREPAAIRAWLFRTATNLAFNYRRRRALLTFLPFTGAERSPQGTYDHEAEHVRAALRSLPRHEAATLLLFYDSGFKRTEIAVLLGVSEETVKSRLARGRQSFMAAYRRLERGLAR